MIYVFLKFTSENSCFKFTNVLIDSAFKTSNIIAKFFQRTFLYGHTYYILCNKEQ